MEENKNVEVQQEEKKSDGSKAGTIFGFLFIIILICGFMFMGQITDFINGFLHKDEQISTTTNTNTPVDTNQTQTKPSTEENKTNETTSVVGIYNRSYKNAQGEDDYASLILRSDNTFVYDESNKDCYNPLVGTYEVNNMIIKFTGKVLYGCDACYYTKSSDIKEFNASIVDGVINYNGSFVKKDGIEGASSVSRYINDPVNGTTPSDNGDPWVSCDK